MASFKNLVSTTSAQISSGGTITGDLVINGDLQVDGGGSLSFDEIIEGTQVIDVNNTEALLVRKNSDNGDVFIVDTTNTRVGLGNTPEVSFHIKLADTATARIEDTSTDGIARLEFKNDARESTIGLFGNSSDDFIIGHGGGTVITIDTSQVTTFSNDVKISKASGSTTQSFVPASGQSSQIKFMQDDGSTQDARIFAPEGATKLAFEAGTTEMMRMTTTGIGIGTTSPQKKVDIVDIYSTGGSSNEDLQLLIRGGNADLDPTGDSIGLGFGYGSADNYVKSGIVHEFTSANGSGTLHFCTSSVSGTDTINKGDARMSISSAGDVTITNNTSTVSYLNLDADGDTDSKFRIVFKADKASDGNGIGDIQFFNNGASPVTEILALRGSTDIKGDLVFNTSNSERMRIDEDGDVTMSGTQVNLQSATADRPILNVENTNADNSPSAIHLYKNSSSPANNDQIGDISWYAKDDGGTKTRLLLLRGLQTDIAASSDDAKLSMYTASNGSEVETLTLSSGSVSIGGVTPDTLLHVYKADASQTADSNSLFTIENSGNTAMTILSGATSHGQIHFGDSGDADDGVVGYDQATSKFYVYTNGSNAKKLVVDASGNTGIGEEVPLGKLHVFTGDSGVTSSANTSGDELVIEGSGDSGLSILTPANKSGNIVFSREGATAVGSMKYHHVNDGTGPNSFIFTAGSSTALTLSSTNATVGGTKLTVTGDANACADIDVGGSFVSVADDSTLTITSSVSSALLIMSEGAGARPAVFHLSYSSTPVLLSDPLSVYSASDTDGKFCVIKSANDHATTFKNRFGSTRTFKFMLIGSSVTS